MSPRELAAAIRKGHTMVGESQSWPARFGGVDCPTCAIGAAIYGAGFSTEDFDSIWHEIRDGCKTGARILNIPHELAFRVSAMHSKGMPRLQVADWLETLDVSKPKDAQSFNDFMKVVTQPVELEAA